MRRITLGQHTRKRTLNGGQQHTLDETRRPGAQSHNIVRDSPDSIQVHPCIRYLGALLLSLSRPLVAPTTSIEQQRCWQRKPSKTGCRDVLPEPVSTLHPPSTPSRAQDAHIQIYLSKWRFETPTPSLLIPIELSSLTIRFKQEYISLTRFFISL